VESSCIENTKLERKEEKKLKERNLRRRRRNSHCASASARLAGETRPKTGQVTSMPASAVIVSINLLKNNDKVYTLLFINNRFIRYF
jgi:hypothetical protein